MDFTLYSSLKCVRKFKFCISPLVKPYPQVIKWLGYIYLTVGGGACVATDLFLAN